MNFSSFLQNYQITNILYQGYVRQIPQDEPLTCLDSQTKVFPVRSSIDIKVNKFKQEISTIAKNGILFKLPDEIQAIILSYVGLKKRISFQDLKNIKSLAATCRVYRNTVDDYCVNNVRYINFASAITKNEILHIISEKFPNIERLNLSFTYMEDKAFRILIGKCVKLQHLSLNETLIQNDIFKELINNRSVLKIIDMMGRLTMQQLNDAIKTIANSCPELEQLNLRDCPMVNDLDLQVLAKSCFKLKRVNLYACKNITITGVNALLNYCPGLEWLDVHGTSVPDENDGNNISQNLLSILRTNHPNLQVDSDLNSWGKLEDEDVE